MGWLLDYGKYRYEKQREKKLKEEIQIHGSSRLIDHLRLCGNIPEEFQHDSSEEKLYSKNTDVLLSFAYKDMGLKSLVLSERGDSADVEAFAKQYSFVADAKAFRLSRTAKNQKDFKIQAMDNWKNRETTCNGCLPNLPITKSLKSDISPIL